jgi:rare lipoprotein A
VTVSAARQQPPAARVAQYKRPPFAAAYRAMLKLVALANLPRIEEDAALAQSAIIGTASTYNPYRHGDDSGGFQTASGEFYDPAAWTAAIQIDLRARAGGVRYGRLYQPTYVLVDSGGKRAIVKINDVGPLKPGRVIDLNERAMRYFDPYLRRGLLTDVKLTLLPGADWTPGPIAGAPLAIFASAK